MLPGAVPLLSPFIALWTSTRVGVPDNSILGGTFGPAMSSVKPRGSADRILVERLLEVSIEGW